MGFKKPKVQYVGPTAEQIKAQQAQQAELLRQQQLAYQQQYESQIAALNKAYQDQLAFVQQQQGATEKAQVALLNQLRNQLDESARMNQLNQGLYGQLADTIGTQTSLLSQIQQQAGAVRGDLGEEMRVGATTRMSDVQERRRLRQQRASQRGVGFLNLLRQERPQTLLR